MRHLDCDSAGGLHLDELTACRAVPRYCATNGNG